MNDDDERKDQSEAAEDASEQNAKVHSEEVKDRHTSHWDMDYMTREEIDAAHREGQEKEPDQDSESE